VTSIQTSAAVDVVLPGAPAIDGLRFRTVAAASDWEGLAELARAASAVDDDDYFPSAESLRIDLESRPNFDLARDLLVAEVDGRIVAAADGNAAVRDGYPVHYIFGRVHPDWRRRGIGRAMFHWNERRARALGAANPTLGGPRAQLGTWVGEPEHGALALVESEGYTINRYAFTMIRRDLQEVTVEPMPDGLEIRPVTPDQHRAIFTADDEAFRDHFEHRVQTDGDFRAMFSQPDVDTSLWRVGWDGDEVAGSVQGWIWKAENAVVGIERGWLERISVRRPWRRRGLAKALITATIVALRERGVEEVLLGVDAQNPNGALALYESLGFEVKVRAMSYRKPLVT